MKILVAEQIPQEGLDLLYNSAQVDIKPDLKPDQLKEIIADYDALIVRSKTRVSAEIIGLGRNLKAIGRAGVGIDNIDVDAATRKGIVVVNAPTGNTVSAAEHAIALMLALARNIPQANTELKRGKWQREQFVGTELRNKTMGIIGLGNVGSEVAKRAQSFEMQVIAYDPFVSEDYAQHLKVSLVSLDELLQKADLVTLHVPSTTTTQNLIGAAELAKMKPTARIINCARGGLVDEKALLKAIQQGKIAGAAFDVFDKEPITDSPLFKEDRIIVTPHLGASTIEAQMNVARDVAEEVLTVLQGQFSRYAVNAPHVPLEVIPFIKAAATIGNLASQLTEGQVNSIHVKYCGEITDYDSKPIETAVISGLLQPVTEEMVNLVNVNLIAAQRGLKVSEEKQPVVKNYPNLITLEINTNVKTTTVSGTVRDSETHIVQVDEFWMDIVPAGGYLLFCYHIDQPGLVGSIGTTTGKANVNISSMHLSRLKPRGSALMILAIDELLPEEQRQEILAIPGIHTVKVVKL
ncbi:MAG: phosphoglycerate dehydrogenase [Chloroflexota bacterium]|nr:phosphoglycerate dehydrogenase [Chloroflexota bacterium]